MEEGKIGRESSNLIDGLGFVGRVDRRNRTYRDRDGTWQGCYCHEITGRKEAVDRRFFGRGTRESAEIYRGTGECSINECRRSFVLQRDFDWQPISRRL